MKISKTFEIDILDEILENPDLEINLIDEIDCQFMSGYLCVSFNFGYHIRHIDIIEVLGLELNQDFRGEGQREEAIEYLRLTLEKLKLAVDLCQVKIKEFKEAELLNVSSN